MSGRVRPAIPLNGLINLLLVAALVATSCGLGLLVQQTYQHGASLQLTRAQLPVYAQALRLVEAISAERGPTNAMLGIREGNPQRLQQARALSDAQFAHLQAALLHCLACSATPAQAEAAYERLRQARAQVDRRLQVPASLADSRGVTDTVQGMLQATADNFVTVDYTLRDLLQRTPGIATCLINSRLAASLRDTAGRLGSLLSAALYDGRPPDAIEQARLQQTQGRVLQLVDLLRTNLKVAPNPAEQARFTQMESAYLGQGLTWYRQTLAVLSSGQTPSAAAFAQGYVPTMGSILELRDVTLQLAEAEIERLNQDAQLQLLLTLVAALGILLVLGTGLLLLKRQLLAPLLANTQRLLALARRHAPAETAAGRDPRTLFAAFQQLELQLHQAELLRRERDALIAELEVRAATDHLTGLANRRSFEQQLAKGVSQGRHLAAIVFDIDHFKRINDRHGHAAGDSLLQQLAQRCQALLREGDRLARIGGEEFAILADVQQAREALELAERLRQGIAATAFQLDLADPLDVTASFGIAVTTATDATTPQQLLVVADAALYRAKHRGRNCSEFTEAR